MKKIVALLFFALCLLPSAFCQIKISKATSQKIIAGMGGVSMKYIIEYAEKKAGSAQIDSVKSIADNSSMTFYTNKKESGVELIFNIALRPTPKCRTCVETTPPQPNLTKGIIIYYKSADKKLKRKVKKFTQLEDLMMP